MKFYLILCAFLMFSLVFAEQSADQDEVGKSSCSKAPQVPPNPAAPSRFQRDLLQQFAEEFAEKSADQDEVGKSSCSKGPAVPPNPANK